jgi:hypothetical protein
MGLMRLLFLIFLFISNTAWAGIQYLTNGPVAITTFGTRYSLVYGTGSNNATEENRQTLLGSLTAYYGDMYVDLSVAPGVGNSVIFTFRVDNGSTPVTCTISGTDTSCRYPGYHFVSVFGNKLSIQQDASGSPSAANFRLFIKQITPSDYTTTVSGGTFGSNASRTAVNYFAAHSGGNTPGTVEANQSMVISTSGTFTGMIIEDSTQPNNGGFECYSYAFMKNGSTCNLTCAICHTDQSCSDLVNTCSVAPGDLVDIRITPSGVFNPTAGKMYSGMIFVPDKQGEFMMAQSQTTPPSTSFVRYTYLNTASADVNSIESFAVSYFQPLLIKDASYSVATAPGAGKSWTYKLRDGYGSAHTGATISGTSTTAAQDLGSFPVGSISSLDTQITPSGSPTSAVNRITYTAMAGQVVSGATVNGGTIQ